MQCPGCGAAHTPEARFCTECGGRLPRRCGACGTERPEHARFCPGCGASLALADAGADLSRRQTPAPAVLTTASALSPTGGENRVVTVLFADLSGSVALTQDLHPEDAQALLNNGLRAMVDAILEHGGQVNRLMGDGALGLFGTPRARETDPERAIMAALQIRDAAAQFGLGVTVGINTGEVYVGDVGSERHQELTVIGAEVNLAARLQSHAQTGEILVGESTFRQTSGMFQFSPRQLALKGLPEPITAYLLEGSLHNRDKGRGIAGLHAPLIGREAELERVLEAVRRAGSGAGQAVCLIGDAGVGKSRLLKEARGRASAEALWLEGRCYELGQAESYGPFIDLLRRHFLWSLNDPEAQRREQLLGCLRALTAAGGLTEQQAEDTAQYLGNLLSLRSGEAEAFLAESSGSERIRNQTFAALRGFIQALAAQRPVVLLLEDLHWADTLSLEFIGFLLETVAASRLTLLCAYRFNPEHRSSRLAELAAERLPEGWAEVRLAELSPEQNRELIERLIGSDVLPEALRETVVSKSHGNPFYLEEVLRSLIDRGVIYREGSGWRARADAELPQAPETIQNLILSRVDQLAPELKELLQEASVVGQVFSAGTLEQMGFPPQALRGALSALRHHGLILQEREALAAEHAFRHVLTRDTIYNTLLRRRRSEIHLRAAEALETIHADRLDDHCDELAHHYVQSGRREKAFEYSLRAARKAERLFANQEALRYLKTALEMLESLPAETRGPQQALETRELLGDILFRLGAHGDAEVQFRAALAICREHCPPVDLARVCSKLADAVHWLGRTGEAIDIAEAGLAALGEARATPEGVKLLEIVIRSHWAEEDLDSARTRAAELERLLPAVPYFDSLYMLHYALAWLEIRREDFARAEQWLEAMREVCQAHDASNGLARCYHGMGDLCRGRGDLAGAAEWFQRSIALCERTGDAHLLLEGHLERAHALILLGHPDEEIEPHVERGMAIAAEMASFGGVSSIQALCHALGRAYSERGDLERGILFLERVFDYGTPHGTEKSLRLLEELCGKVGRPEQYHAIRQRVQSAAGCTV